MCLRDLIQGHVILRKVTEREAVKMVIKEGGLGLLVDSGICRPLPSLKWIFGRKKDFI